MYVIQLTTFGFVDLSYFQITDIFGVLGNFKSPLFGFVGLSCFQITNIGFR